MAIDNSDLNVLLNRALIKADWTNKRKIVKARRLMTPTLLFLDNSERWLSRNIRQLHLVYRIKNNHWGQMKKYNPRNTYAYRKVAPDDFEPKQRRH